MFVDENEALRTLYEPVHVSLNELCSSDQLSVRLTVWISLQSLALTDGYAI